MARILVTGATGNIGLATLEKLATGGHEILATDVRDDPAIPDGVRYQDLDVRDEAAVQAIVAEFQPDAVVHLASVVTPGKGPAEKFAYDVDVNGTQYILDACTKQNVRRLVVTSSGAAYGYHADNPVPIHEDWPTRGNDAYAYSRHKSLIEQMLRDARSENRGPEQVILRLCAVLGPGLDNQLVALFHRKRLLAIRNTVSPFVFVWLDDLAEVIVRAATDGPAGEYNVAGDGQMTVDEIAGLLGKGTLTLPAWGLRLVLAIAKPLGLSQYGPEQVPFLQYRPVLANDALKEKFGYQPKLSSAEAFAAWRKTVGL